MACRAAKACGSFAVDTQWRGPNGRGDGGKSGVYHGLPVEAQLFSSRFVKCFGNSTGGTAAVLGAQGAPPPQPGCPFNRVGTLWIKKMTAGHRAMESASGQPALARGTDADTGAGGWSAGARPLAPALLNQNYLLFRYQQLIQGNGSTAIHFNGGILDWGATGNNGQPNGVPDHGNPDFRVWGYGFWFQNVRMAYYPNLPDGDSSMLLGLFRHYLRTVPVLQARAKSWFGAGNGSLYFAETTFFWGDQEMDDFGCSFNRSTVDHQSYGTPKGRPDVANKFMWHHIEGGIELAQLMVRHYHYTGDAAVLRKYTLPWCDGVLAWYDTHYPKHPNGTILMLNAKSCETYNHCTNPAAMTAGLHMVVDGLLALVPAATLGPARQAFLERFQKAIPDIPLMRSADNNPAAPADAVQIAPCLVSTMPCVKGSACMSLVVL
eukprot:SAG22_NODE_263_length_13359_cov_3.396531_12_plen_434_part_00